MDKKLAWDIRLCLFAAGYTVLALLALVWTAPFESIWFQIVATPPILILAFLIFKEVV